VNPWAMVAEAVLQPVFVKVILPTAKKILDVLVENFLLKKVKKVRAVVHKKLKKTRRKE